jgi:protein-L-isoaspartate(D-aspartate) O-methyltransferase
MMTADDATTRRAALIEELARRDALHDPAVRAALLAIPRDRFLPDEPLERAYADDAIPTKFTPDGTAISSASQPAIVALMLEQLAIAPGMRVLEIGAGTGYNAALLRTLVGPTGHVTTMDIDTDITDAAMQHLASISITDVDVITGDGAHGWAANAPYDRVILTVNASDIAPAWFDQLTDGGILVLPLTVGPAQLSIAFERRGGVLSSRSLCPCGFMPLRGSMGDGATGSRPTTAAPGLRVRLTNATAHLAEQIAALLQTPPTPRDLPQVGAGWFYALAFTLATPGQSYIFALVSSEDVRYGFVGDAYGLFDATGTSGCIIGIPDSMDGRTIASVRTYGGAEAADWLTRVLDGWKAAGAPRPQAQHITAYPMRAPSIPSGGPVIDLPHWRLVVERPTTPSTAAHIART